MIRIALKLCSFTCITLFAIGCNQTGSFPQKATTPSPPRLNDLSTQDTTQRQVDGITIIGSALTDDHISAIRALTDSTKPSVQDSEPEPLRIISHDGPNAALNDWRVDSLQIYQKLEFKDGAWAILEEGGGFVHGQ